MKKQDQRQVKMCIYLYLFRDWFPLEFAFIYIFSLMNKYFAIVNQKKIKSSGKEYVM